MAEIKGFKAMRFTDAAGKIEELTCPPYDIISEDERREFLQRNSHNVIRLELPREGADPYAEAGATLDKWLADGILAVDDKDGLYIYEEEFAARGGTYKVKGFICRVRLTPFSEGVVLPHEETLSKAKKDRFELMKATDCNFSQIYSLYMDDDGRTGRMIDELSAGEAAQCFTDASGVTHRLWIVTDETAVEKICADFEGRKLYIADGHHRYETAVNYSAYLKENGINRPDADYVMMMLVAMDNSGLVVFPTHRVLHDLPDFSADRVLEKCAEYFDIERIPDGAEERLTELYEQGKKAFAMYSGGVWNLMTLRSADVMAKLMPESSPALRDLDVSVLHSLVLERIFGIDKENMAAQINLKYTRDISEAVSEVDGGRADCCFILNPTRVGEIRDVAAAGEKMPQKSTYFYPKLITGMVMNKF